MSLYINNVLRIKRSASQETAMQMLIQSKVFAGYKDILMISAIIGYNENRFVPIEKAASDGVLMSFFNNKDYDIFDLLAYSHKKQQSIVKDDEKYEIFSSYANGGFPILLEKLNLTDINELSLEEARKAQCRYYSLLLDGSFIPEAVSVENEDLFI